MTNPGRAPQCDDEAVHRYVAGRLAGPELDAFEVHLLTCARCRRDVREGATIAASLEHRVPRRHMVTARRVSIWAGALAAAAVAALLIPRDTAMVRLSRLESPPLFEPLAVRASVTPTDRIVDSAMTSYLARDFSTARRLLKRASELGAHGSVDFYFGAAALADGAPREAVEPLTRLVIDDASPYAEHARLLLAKALIGSGRSDSAAAVLASASDARARALSDSLRSLRAP